VEPLGTLRYVPAATPALVERWRRRRGVDWAAMPVVVFNEKDDLQHAVLRRHGVDVPPRSHRVPTSADFLEAVRLGLGWGAVPEPQLRPELAAGVLVPLTTRDHVDVPLHWQRWRLDSPLLDRLTDTVRTTAGARLRR
jgi:LysR family transcriptional regulator (chromosome initiation inhibitor)